MLRIRLDLKNLSTVTSMVTSQTREERSGLRNEVLNSLALHQDGMKTSLHQVYEQVDQRIAKVEDMLKVQADQVQTGQSTQVGPLYRGRPMNRRRLSPQAVTSVQPLQPPNSEGVRVRLNQYASRCRSGCHCACHVSSTSATPALVDRVLGPACRSSARNVTLKIVRNRRSLMSALSTGFHLVCSGLRLFESSWPTNQT